MSNTHGTPAELRAEAARHDQEARDSFDRSDTDGALSQWAHGVSAVRLRAEAELAEDGGRSDFPCLFTLDGQIVRSRLRNGRFGLYWTIETVDEYGNPAPGGTVNHPKLMKTLEAKGYRVGLVNRPAGVDVHVGFVGGVGTAYRYPYGPWSEARVVHTGEGFTRTDEVYDWVAPRTDGAA